MRGAEPEVSIAEQVRSQHMPNLCNTCVPQTFTQALQSAKEQLARSLLK